jgi:hypothetical protein
MYFATRTAQLHTCIVHRNTLCIHWVYNENIMSDQSANVIIRVNGITDIPVELKVPIDKAPGMHIVITTEEQNGAEIYHLAYKDGGWKLVTFADLTD